MRMDRCTKRLNEKGRITMNSMPTQLARIAAVACSLAIGGNAMAGLVTVRYSDYFEEDLIVNHNDIFIAGFTPVLTTAPTTPGSYLHNSMRFSFRPSGDRVSALVSGNSLPVFPPEPFNTLALCFDGGVDQLGTTIGPAREWLFPELDLSTGAVQPASLSQLGDSGTMNISIIPDNGFAFVGYATSDLSMFGYMQIQRLSLYEWRLIGYAYNDTGAPVTVENIVPSGGPLALLSAGSMIGVRRRRPVMA